LKKLKFITFFLRLNFHFLQQSHIDLIPTFGFIDLRFKSWPFLDPFKRCTLWERPILFIANSICSLHLSIFHPLLSLNNPPFFFILLFFSLTLKQVNISNAGFYNFSYFPVPRHLLIHASLPLHPCYLTNGCHFSKHSGIVCRLKQSKFFKKLWKIVLRHFCIKVG